MKHAPHFQEFLKVQVNLDQTRLDRLDGHVAAVETYLSNNLGAFQRIERQGSYALGTITKPVRDAQEYDADILVFMDDAKGWDASRYITTLYQCLRESDRYGSMVSRRTRCVELDYAGDVHLDIVPCVKRGGQTFICNRKDNKFEETDGTGYREWFNGRSAITTGNLKRVVRLLKYMRDHKRNFSVKSILLTTLAGNAVDDGGEFGTVPVALHAIMNEVNDYLQNHTLMPQIENPALPGESFTRHWDQPTYENFREKFDLYTSRVNDAITETDHNKSVRKWREVLGDDFGELTATPANTRSTSVRPRKPYAR